VAKDNESYEEWVKKNPSVIDTMHWYELIDYLEKDEYGSLKHPYKIIPSAPDWCEETLCRWMEKKKKGFKVP